MASPQILKLFTSCYHTCSTIGPSFIIVCCQVRFSVLIFDHSATTYSTQDVTHAYAQEALHQSLYYRPLFTFPCFGFACLLVYFCDFSQLSLRPFVALCIYITDTPLYVSDGVSQSHRALDGGQFCFGSNLTCRYFIFIFIFYLNFGNLNQQ